MSDPDFTIVFDGGSLGNPGRGYGSYRIRRGDGTWEPAVRLELGDRVTNNEAEYRSLLAALGEVERACGDPKATRLEIRGDSLLVINHLNGTWRVRAGNLRPLFDRARAALWRFGGVHLVWQPRADSVELLGH